METPKLGVESRSNIHFQCSIYLVENASIQAGEHNQRLRLIRSEYLRFLLNKLNIGNGCHAEFWGFHGYPQLTLGDNIQIYYSMKPIY